MRYTTLLIVVLACLHLAACGDPPASEVIGTGQMDGRTYTHDHFGLSITFPEGWDIMGRAEFEEAMNVSGDALAQSGVDERGMEASKSNTIALFMVTRGGFSLETGTPCGFSALAERVKNHPEVETAKDYNDTILDMYREIGLPITWRSDRSETISGVEFNVRPMSISAPHGEVLFSLYSAKMGDYILLFSTTAVGYDNQQRLEELMKEIKLEAE